MKVVSYPRNANRPSEPVSPSGEEAPATPWSLGASLLVVLAALAAVICLLALTTAFAVRSPVQPGWLFPAQGVLAVSALTLLGIMAWSLWRQVLKPLARLREWTLQMQAGDFAARVPEPPGGALAALTRDINELGEALQACSRDMEAQVHKQTERLGQKTRSLEILYDVATSINVSRDLDELLKRFLHTLKDVAAARAASVRLLTDDGQMRMVASIGLDAELIEAERLIPAERCLCALAANKDDVYVEDDLRRCGEIVGRPFFADEKAQMIAVPLRYRDRVVGLYNLFVDDPQSIAAEGVRELLTSIGRHLGTAIEKARLDAESNRLSILDERSRLGHELHDSLAQTLASLRFQVRVLDETLHQGDESAVWQELERVENSLDEAYAELRALIAQFRAPIGARGLVPAIEEAVNRFRRETGVHILLQNEWEGIHFPAETEMQIIRIVQESLNNIRKHANAQTVRVMLGSEEDAGFRVLVEDDGAGFGTPAGEGPPGEHIGLSIMQDRARQLGGELRIESEPGEGTRVLLSFPDPWGPVETQGLKGYARTADR